MILGSFIAGAATAQNETIDAAELAERQRSIPVLENHIQEREQRMAELAEDIIRLDKRLEGKIERIVTNLKSLKDSQSSGYRVSGIKMNAIDGLKKTIENYQSKRAGLINEIREGRSGIPEEVLKGDVKKFDGHIEKRVSQILELSKSFTQDEDVEKYQKSSIPSYNWDGSRSDYYEISDEWKQNRKDRTMDKKQRAGIIEALEKSIARHEGRVVAMKAALKDRQMSEASRELLTSELEHDEALLDARRAQFSDMMEVDVPKTEAITRDAAMEIEEAIADAVKDMRQDSNSIFSKYDQLNQERSQIARLKSNLEARKKWMAEYLKSQGTSE